MTAQAYASDPLVSADAVTRRFGDFTAVANLTMEVRPGEVVGLLGANGAGKTTLIRMLLGLLAPTDGHVTMLGGKPDRDHRRRVGYVPQGLGLYQDMSVEENLAFIADTYAAPTAVLPDSLASYREVLVAKVPLGARREIAFIAALSHTPEVLLLDEPTSGVDALSRARLWDDIRGQADDGVGILVTTHHMQEAAQCDRLLLLRDGKLVGQGSEADVIAGTTAVAVGTDRWERAFDVLNAAGVAVMLDGTAVRTVGTSSDDVREVLARANLVAQVHTVPATIEERMLVLAQDGL
ncbi:MAG: ABC transporter ATP-binding protein [Nostocoides sp.]